MGGGWENQAAWTSHHSCDLLCSKAADGRGYGWVALHKYHLDVENSLARVCVFY